MKFNLFIANKILSMLQKASCVAIKHFNDLQLDVIKKADNSPVTKADLEINDIICSFLQNTVFKHLKSIGQLCIISEEWQNCIIMPCNINDSDKITFFIDPIDGTRDFVKKSKDFTINIGICINKIPAISFIVAPAHNECYFGFVKKKKYSHLIDYNSFNTDGNALFCKNFNGIKGVNLYHFSKLVPSKRTIDKAILTISTNPKEAKIVDILQHKNQVKYISSSYKACIVCQGIADLYCRIGNTYEWDTAAAHALALACNCHVLNADGSKLKYEKASQNYKNTKGFCMVNAKANFRALF